MQKNGIIYIEPLQLIEKGDSQKIVALAAHNTPEGKLLISPELHIGLKKYFKNDIPAAAASWHMEKVNYKGAWLYAFVIERNNIDLLYELAIQLEKKFLPLCGITGTFPVIAAVKEQLLLVKTISPEPWEGN